jgi:hypothetical protein
MRCRLLGPVAVAGAVTVAAVMAAVSPASAAGRGPVDPAAVSRASLSGRAVTGTGLAMAPAGQSAALARQVLLINGNRVQVSADGGGSPSGVVVPAAGGGVAGSVVSLGLGARTYEVPAAAVPYLGRGLDPDLFDTSELLARETGGLLPVQVSYRGQVPVLPGIRITSSGDGTAEGYLTASSALVFGAALDRQYGADRDRGSYGTDGMFADGVSIALAGTVSSSAVHPDYVMHTLTVNATDLAGSPDTGDLVLLVNVDNTSLVDLLSSESEFYDGTAKYSVPSGHYFALGIFGDLLQGPEHVVVLPQFTVAGNTAVNMAETAASSEITMVTPRPASAVGTGFYVVRTGAEGPLSYVEFADAGAPVWVSPTNARPTVGTLQSYANQVLASAPGQPGVPYSYELSETAPPGLIPSQRYQVRAADLATVNERYYQAAVSSGTWIMLGSFPTTDPTNPFIGFVEPYEVPLSLPGRQTVYVGGAGTSPMTWASDYQAAAGDYWSSEAGRLLPAGGQVTDRWGAYPLHPAANFKLYPKNTVLGLTQASAAREGNTLWLDVTPFTDSQPGHLSTGFFPAAGVNFTGSYAVYQDGKQVAAGNAVQAAAQTNGDVPVRAQLGPKPSTIQFVLTASRSGTVLGPPTASQTVWTWRSVQVPGATLPAGWYCDRNTLASDCAVQPMMTLGYTVAGLGLNESAPAGRQVLSVSVGHIQLAKASAIAGAKVSVSFDGGKTWQAAAVTRTGAARFRAVFSAPAGVSVALRTSATDAAGGSITETIDGGYQIAS